MSFFFWTQVIPKAVGPNMSKFVAYAANGGWDGNYGELEDRSEGGAC